MAAGPRVQIDGKYQLPVKELVMGPSQPGQYALHAYQTVQPVTHAENAAKIEISSQGLAALTRRKRY